MVSTLKKWFILENNFDFANNVLCFLVIGKATCIQLKPKGSETFKVEVAVDKGGMNLNSYLYIRVGIEKKYFHVLLCRY